MALQTKLFSTASVALAIATLANAAPTCSAVGPNLLSNPGFEASKTTIEPWTFDEGTFGKVISPGENSKNALDIGLKNTPDGGEPGFSQAVSPTCPGDYLFTFDYRFLRQGPRAGLVTTVLGGNSGFEFIQQSNTTYTKFEEYYPNTDLEGSDVVNFQFFPLQHAPMNNGFVVDNVQLVSAGQVNVKSGAKEQVRNGGFETGKLAPFTTFDNSGSELSIVSPGLVGNYALLVGATSGEGYLAANVTTTPGSHYEFSLTYGYPKKTTAQSFASISLSTETSYFGFDGVQKGVHDFNRRFVAHGPITTVSLTFEFGLNAANLTVDNISVREIVKPSVA